MSKKKAEKKIGGPFVVAALLCNSVTEDSDGVLSALRIVDEVRAVLSPAAPANFPSKEMPVELSLFALIMIRRGDAPAGKHDLKLTIERPNGETSELYNQAIDMPEHPNGAFTVKARLRLKLHSQGLFWIDVLLNSKCLTRMVLNLVLQRAEVPSDADSR
jgi:hypothetical protein